MTMNHSRLISNRIPLILENHDHVSLKINADASGCFDRNDEEKRLKVTMNIASIRLKCYKNPLLYPHFNEVQNLPVLPAQVRDVFNTLRDWGYECIAVDDACTDDTRRPVR